MTLVIGKDLVHLRLACHMDTKSEISTGLISFATLIWVVIASLTENSLHIKVSLSLRCRCRKRSQWGKKQKLIMLNSKFGLKFDGFFLKWNLLFELHCMIQWNPPQIISLLGPFERIIQDLQQMHFLASKVNSNTNLTEELTKIASDKGFRISDNQESGNCMFHALSEQLETVKGIKIENSQLRQSLVQYLRENPKLVSYNEPHT